MASSPQHTPFFPNCTPSLPTALAISTSESSPSCPPMTPAKRLRSCLSPTRTPTGERTPSTRPTSRTTSFGSEYGSGIECWKSAKSVRWEGDNEGNAVTSYHHTWSATEYDRTPLEPPSEAERTCVLPERGSRTFTTSYDCFDDSNLSRTSASMDVTDETDDVDAPSSPGDEISHDSLVLATPLEEERISKEDQEEERQWEECMERRRRLFAIRRCEDEERQPQFEGYRSITAKLVSMLQSIEARRLESPAETDEEDETSGAEDAEQANLETDEESDIRSYASFTFSNLQSLHIGRSDDEPSEVDIEGPTPSLTCSETSEAEQQIISPRSSMMPISACLEKGAGGVVEVGSAIAA